MIQEGLWAEHLLGIIHLLPIPMGREVFRKPGVQRPNVYLGGLVGYGDADTL